MDVPRLLRDARRAAGLTQAALAARVKTSQSAIARYETGTTAPSLATFERLLRACGRDFVRVEDDGVRTTSHARSLGTTRATLVRVRRGKLLRAARRHGVRHLRLFGSVARGHDNDTSDVDLLVELAPRRTLLDLIGFQQDAEEILGLAVDVATPAILKEGVRTRALRDARAI